MRETGLIRVSRCAARTTAVGGLRNHLFVHSARHRTLGIGKPFEVSFGLHGDGLLTLLDVVRSRLPNAECVFMSTCRTTRLTDKSIAGAVQYEVLS
ncbi:hypothetical protein BJV78DRAFT_1228460 [Lactifluus subvellereus]|nr:hypothetical protein BJV78DRAFT_1228460 [Lactifluus subvellereus]